MRAYIFILIFIFLNNCSFDNKSGIWKNENLIKEKDDKYKDYKILTETNEIFDKVINLDKEFIFKKNKLVKNSEWSDIFYSDTNNIDNFLYNESKNTFFKSKRISRHKIKNKLLFVNNYIIANDEKGNIIIFSIDDKKIINKFNFYKKQYKKIQINLNLVVKKNIIYVSDNIGYLYAFDFIKNKIVWAKNYKIPFRSNLKIFNSKLVGANQNNMLYFFDINNGDIIKLIPTEETVIKNVFINNLSLNKEYTLFLNTYGSIYGINHKNMRPNWFINLNPSVDINPSNLFKGQPLVSDKKYVIASSNNFTYIIDINSGAVLFKKNFSPALRPLIIGNYLFLITRNNFLISMNLNNGKIIYSYEIEEKLANHLNTKKKNELEIKYMSMANNRILVFLNNSHLIKFKINGEIDEILKFKDKIYSSPIFVNGSMIYLNKSNKISIVN